MLQAVEFAGQPVAVAAQTFGSENGSIPEVGANVAVDGVTDMEIAIVANGYKFSAVGGGVGFSFVG